VLPEQLLRLCALVTAGLATGAPAARADDPRRRSGSSLRQVRPGARVLHGSDHKYLDAADKAFPLAVAPYPERDKPVKLKWYLGDNGGIMDRAFNADAAPLTWLFWWNVIIAG